MELKDRLKELRMRKGLSQVALADRLDVSKSTIGAYETGDRRPSYEALWETFFDDNGKPGHYSRALWPYRAVR